jgi:DNA-binding transcriptional MerR regulator
MNMATIERPRPRQSQGLLTINQISRQSGVGVRPLVFLVRRAGIAPGRYRGTYPVYSPDDIFQTLAALDLAPGANISVALLRTRLKDSCPR